MGSSPAVSVMRRHHIDGDVEGRAAYVMALLVQGFAGISPP